MIFRRQDQKINAVCKEISYLEAQDRLRESHLNTVSSALSRRASELDKLVEQMKESRRGQNG